MRIVSIIFLILLLGCRHAGSSGTLETQLSGETATTYKFIADIPVPDGYTRMAGSDTSFAEWLRQRPLKRDKTVYLFNGKKKKNQLAQFAVMDIQVGEKDLQQCADAVMRLRADFLFEAKRFSDIIFLDNNSKVYRWQNGGDRMKFDRYLEEVFVWCGSASLEAQLHPVRQLATIQPGDVFIKGGYPGHAMMVIDVAMNSHGKKVFMLAQSYMPAQDIHIVQNPADNGHNPWYEVDEKSLIITPEWTFTHNQLRRW